VRGARHKVFFFENLKGRENFENLVDEIILLKFDLEK
jgi:hypothetical protein